jgi:hypothetical protein
LTLPWQEAQLRERAAHDPVAFLAIDERDAGAEREADAGAPQPRDPHTNAKALPGQQRAPVEAAHLGHHRGDEAGSTTVEGAHEPRPRLRQVRDIDVVRDMTLRVEVAHQDAELVKFERVRSGHARFLNWLKVASLSK